MFAECMFSWRVVVLIIRAAGPEDVEGQYFCHGNLRVMKILHTRGWFDGLMRQLSFLSLDDHRMSAKGS